MTKTTNQEMDMVLRNYKFNQLLGKALLIMANDSRREAYENIVKVGSKKALEKMQSWETNKDLSLVYVRDYLEALIDVDINAPHIDEMNEKQFEEWCKRSDEYEADKKKATIKRAGYEKWFIDKWFAEVTF